MKLLRHGSKQGRHLSLVQLTSKSTKLENIALINMYSTQPDTAADNGTQAGISSGN